MKKLLFVLLAVVFAAGMVHAQTTDVLTNTSIVKMVKAKLSNELIIDMIQTSEVQFDISTDAVNSLKAELVPDQVIEAMKVAARTQQKEVSAPQAEISSSKIPETPAAPVAVVVTAAAVTPAVVQQSPLPTETITKPQAEAVQTQQQTQPQPQPKPLTPGVKPTIETPEAAPVVEALSYTIPLRLLVAYYEEEYVLLSAEISRWDKQIRDSLEAINKINAQINQLESELRAKKNAGSQKYSSEILALINKQNALRTRYKQAKNNMLLTGEAICKKLEAMSSKKNTSLGDTYDEARAQIKDMKLDPSRVGSAVPVTFTKLKIYDNTTKFLTPLSEMLVWHKNEIDELYKIAIKYNAKVSEVIEKDAALSTQLEPINSKLNEYKADTKKYKQEIASLKKQKSALEKQRKLVTDSMENDSNELSANLKTLRAEIQASSKERFADIINNINFLFQEKPAL